MRTKDFKSIIRQHEEWQKRKELSCPECEGTNLNEDGTLCWDCETPDVDI